MIGLFGVSEVIRSVMGGELAYPITRVRTGHIFRGMWALFRKYQVNFWRSGIIRTFIEILPGAGADIAAWVAYAASKRFSGKSLKNTARDQSKPSLTRGQPIIPVWQETRCRPLSLDPRRLDYSHRHRGSFMKGLRPGAR